jgi:hypothetical protein
MNGDAVSIIVLVLSFVILVACLFYQIKKNGLRKVAIDVIVKAEELLGSGKGKEKMQYAITQFLVLLPKPIRVFFTVESVENFIQEVFDDIKDALEYKEV